MTKIIFACVHDAGRSQMAAVELAADAQWLVTMGCGDRVREIRDDIEARVRELIAANGWS